MAYKFDLDAYKKELMEKLHPPKALPSNTLVQRLRQIAQRPKQPKIEEI